MTYMPTEEELRREIEQQKRFFLSITNQVMKKIIDNV